MTVAESGGIRLEATDGELRIHAPKPAASWPREWLTDWRWWRLMREVEYLGTPEAIDYSRFSDLLREGFRFPVLFGGWSPLRIVIGDSAAPRFLLGDIEVSAEYSGRYIRRTGADTAWLLDEASWLLLGTPADQHALRRDLAVEANACLQGEIARTEIIYSDRESRRYATRNGWVEQRLVEHWSGPSTPLCGRVALRDGLPVRLPGRGNVLWGAGPQPAAVGSTAQLNQRYLSDCSRAELLAVIACTFLWRGFRLVFPADACWLSDCVLTVRDGTVTAVWLLDRCDRAQLEQVRQDTDRLRRVCPGDYTAGVVVRGSCPRAAKSAGHRMGIRVRDRYELENLVDAAGIPAAAIRWALAARCSSVGETLELLREARMLT